MAKTSAKHPTWRCHGPDQTEALAARLAPLLPPMSVVGLVGDLGAGKTCFARGMARGLGIDPRSVASPTFVYMVDYPSERGPLYHADLYRLGELSAEATAEALESIGLQEAFCSAALTVVEWWDYYRGPDPLNLVRVEFAIENVDDRSIELEFIGAGLSDAACRLDEQGRGEASR